MPTKAQALDAVKVGDVVFGLGAGGQPKLLLVYRVGRDGFSARHVTTQLKYRFGRNGRTRMYADGGFITIVSTAALPPDMHETALGLDRKWAARPEYPDSILSPAEIHLLLRHEDFHRAHLLPGTEATVITADKFNSVRNYLLLEWDPADAPNNPPSLIEYNEYLSELIDLLDRPASPVEVATFLADMANRRGRPHVPERNQLAAERLLRLRQGWT